MRIISIIFGTLFLPEYGMADYSCEENFLKPDRILSGKTSFLSTGLSVFEV